MVPQDPKGKENIPGKKETCNISLSMLNVTQPNLGIIFISYSEVRNPKDFQSVTTDCCNGQLPKELLVDDLSVE